MIAGYVAARESAALVDRSDGARLRIRGRAPARMLTGIVTGRMPPDLREEAPGVRTGEAPPSAVLTPKGKVVTLLRVFRLANGEDGSFLLEVPRAGAAPLREHLQRYLPPRFARVEDVSAEVAFVTLLGPSGPGLLARAAPELAEDPASLQALAEDEERVIDDGSEIGLRVVRSGEVDVLSLDLLGEEKTVHSLRDRLVEAGAVLAGREAWETLRVERGRPAFGPEVDEGVIPTEAGLEARLIDHEKGCYTGQEVIVRIRDRGRVNRHLRGLLLGDAPLPLPGTDLFSDARERPVGEVRSAVASPRFGQGAALAYVRREVEPPGTVRVGAPDGPPAEVRALGVDGWALVEGDPG